MVDKSKKRKDELSSVEGRVSCKTLMNHQSTGMDLQSREPQ